MDQIRVFFVSLTGTICLAACASQDAFQFTASQDFQYNIIIGSGFRHVVFERFRAAENDVLHVYIDGDGQPWDRGFHPSVDPTPRNILMLRLASQDPSNVAFVGRPCYFGLAGDVGCEPGLWTSHRYSDEVVASMATVIDEITSRSGTTRVVLIGYSGGGVLATLLANRLHRVTGVLSVAGNLDTEAWTAHHGYEPLHGSVNPADESSEPGGYVHVQAIGLEDEIVPEYVTSAYRQKHSGLIVWKYRDFDHVCCWNQHWPDIMKRFNAALRTDHTAIAD